MQRDTLDDLLTASTEDKDKRSFLTNFAHTLLYGLRQVRKRRGHL